MKVKPMSAQEQKNAEAPPLLPDGDYDFEIIGATEKQSKNSGMMMFELQLRILLEDDKSRLLRDYVMTEGAAAHRLRQVCECVGLLRHYEQGDIDAQDFENLAGRATLMTQADKTGTYADQNRVKRYLPANGAAPPMQRPAAPKRPVMADADLDDDIPF